MSQAREALGLNRAIPRSRFPIVLFLLRMNPRRQSDEQSTRHGKGIRFVERTQMREFVLRFRRVTRAQVMTEKRLSQFRQLLSVKPVRSQRSVLCIYQLR